MKHSVFERLCRQFFIPDVDLFASRLNRQLGCFVTSFSEPGAFAVNAFSLCWAPYKPYLFPPFNLIGKVLCKVLQDKVDEALIVLPYWPSQIYFPVFLGCLCSIPVRIPRHGDILTLVHDGSLHPLGKSLQLVAAVVSGRPWRVQAFQHSLWNSSSTLGQQGCASSMSMLGKSCICGNILGQVIHFGVLKQ